MFNETKCSLFDNEWTIVGWMHYLKSWTIWGLPQTSTKSWKEYSPLIRWIHIQYFRSANCGWIQGICGSRKKTTCHSAWIGIVGNPRNTHWSLVIRHSRCWTTPRRKWMAACSIASSKESLNVSLLIGISIYSLRNIVK